MMIAMVNVSGKEISVPMKILTQTMVTMVWETSLGNLGRPFMSDPSTSISAATQTQGNYMLVPRRKDERLIDT